MSRLRELAREREVSGRSLMSRKQWSTYARICGRSPSHSHSLSDGAGLLDVDTEPEILRADHALGAFTAIDRVFT